MTKTTAARPIKAGDILHVLAGGVLLFGWAYRRGDMLKVTAKDIEDSQGLDGKSWTDDLSEEGQLARWGEIRLGFGPWPAGTPCWTHGDPEWAEQREEARKRAWRLEDPVERAAARERVEKEFGTAPTTSRTLNEAPTVQQRPSGIVGR